MTTTTNMINRLDCPRCAGEEERISHTLYNNVQYNNNNGNNQESPGMDLPEAAEERRRTTSARGRAIRRRRCRERREPYKRTLYYILCTHIYIGIHGCGVYFDCDKRHNTTSVQYCYHRSCRRRRLRYGLSLVCKYL